MKNIILLFIYSLLFTLNTSCQVVDNWQREELTKDTINLSIEKPLTYQPYYTIQTSELDEYYPTYRPDSVNIKFWSDTTLEGLMIKIEKLERELNFIGSEYQTLSIKVHELRIENDRLNHKLNNLINKQ